MADTTNTILKVIDLRTELQTEDGTLHAIRGVDFEIDAGKTLGLVGESGCGKSMTAYSILRLTPEKASSSGEVHLSRSANGSATTVDLLSMSPTGEAIRNIRGNDIALIFQEPMTAFSPVHTIGQHMVEALTLHKTDDKAEARRMAIELLRRVGLSNPGQRIDEYPHQLSGGMRQRVMIALALSCEPRLLIADEPTTALDVTIQAQVLDLMREFQELLGMSMLYITHDLGVIAELADEVAVMYLGQVVEHAPVEALFEKPLHPYTDGLMQAIPQLGKARKERLASIEGTVPVPIDIPVGCSFYSRCKRRIEGLCNTVDPPLVELEPKHKVRCFLYPEVQAAANAIDGNRMASALVERNGGTQ